MLTQHNCMIGNVYEIIYYFDSFTVYEFVLCYVKSQTL